MSRLRWPLSEAARQVAKNIRVEKTDTKRRLSGWTVVIPDPGKVAAQAELAYWRSLTPEQSVIELELEGCCRRRGFAWKSAVEVEAIRAAQSAVLGIEAGGDFETARREILNKRAVRDLAERHERLA